MASRDLIDADQKLADAFAKIKGVFESAFPRYELRPTCTYRSKEEQLAAFNLGRSKLDGITRASKHNVHPSQAIDVGIFRRNPKGVPAAYIDDLLRANTADRTVLDPDLHRAMYWAVGLLAQAHGLRWGGDWNANLVPVDVDPAESLNDPYHWEIRG